MDPIDDLLADLLTRPDDQWWPGLLMLCAEHPESAAELRRRFGQLERCGIAMPTEPSVTTATLAESPQRLGPYRLLRRLGGGGMGVVWLGLHDALQREVAIKMIRPERLWFDNARDRFRREIEAVARLRHQGCVQIHEVGEVGDVPYFVMEYVQGANCEQIVAALRERAGDMEPARLTGADLVAVLRDRGAVTESGSSELFQGPWTRIAIAVVLAAAEALAHAHSRGVIHRDLKPSNLMVTHDGRVVVIDFGLAVADGSSSLTREGSQLGSVPYMAPEQLRGEQTAIGERTDVYALGICLYELLTLRLPFPATAEQQLRQAILTGACVPIRTHNGAVSRDLAVVVAQAMHVDPMRRYQSASEFAADLIAVLTDRPIRAQRDAVLARLARWARRHPAWATAAMLSLLAVVVLPTAFSIAIAGQLERAVTAEQLARRREYTAAIAAATAALRAGNGAEARLRLTACADDLRGFEWRHLAMALDSSLLALEVGDPVTAVAATRDGASAAGGTSDGRVVLFGLQDPRRRVEVLAPGGPVVESLSFDAAGAELFVIDAAETLYVFGVDDGRERRRRPRGRDNERLVLPRPVDRVLCDIGDGRVTVLDSVTLAPRDTVTLATGAWADAGGWTLVGDELFTGGQQGVSRWRLRDGARLGGSVTKAITLLGASPRGECVGLAEDAVIVSRLELGTEHRFDPGSRQPVSAVLLQDGRYVVAPCDTGEVLVFDVASGVLRRTLLGHRGRVEAIAGIGDGGTFVTGGADGVVRLWSIHTANEQIELAGIGEGRALAVDPRGRLLTGDDGAVMCCVDADTGALLYATPHLHWVNAVIGVPTDDLIVSACGSDLRWFAASDGAPRGTLTLPAEFGSAHRLAVDGDATSGSLAVGSPTGQLAFVDLRNRTVSPPRGLHEGRMTGLVYDATRQRFLSAGIDGTLMASGVSSSIEMLRIPARFTAIAIVGDRMLCAEQAGPDAAGTLSERDLATGAVLRSVPVDDVVVAMTAIERDRFVVGTARGFVAVWDALLLAPVFEQRQFTRSVRNVVAGPQGDWIAAIGFGGAPRILRAERPRADEASVRSERQRIAHLSQLAASAMATTRWRPAAERHLSAAAGLTARDRDAAIAMLPPENAWSLAMSCYSEFASAVACETLQAEWQPRYASLREAVAEGRGGHELLSRSALALGAVRCHEPRVALDALAPVVLPPTAGPDDDSGWFRPSFHFARGMAHVQLGDLHAARVERDALQRLLDGAFAADNGARRFLRELEDVLAR